MMQERAWTLLPDALAVIVNVIDGPNDHRTYYVYSTGSYFSKIIMPSPPNKLVLVASLLTLKVFALNNGLAKTPAMGWNSYNAFSCVRILAFSTLFLLSG